MEISFIIIQFFWGEICYINKVLVFNLEEIRENLVLKDIKKGYKDLRVVSVRIRLSDLGNNDVIVKDVEV